LIRNKLVIAIIDETPRNSQRVQHTPGQLLVSKTRRISLGWKWQLSASKYKSVALIGSMSRNQLPNNIQPMCCAVLAWSTPPPAALLVRMT